MNMRFASFSLSLLMGAALLSSCGKNDGPAPTTAFSVQNIAADTAATGHYTFFNLKDGKQVALTDSASTKWDIAFRGTNILVNGGASGPGQGGAMVLNGVYNDITELTLAGGVPTGAAGATLHTPFQTDSATGTTKLAITTGSGNGWYNYDAAANLITPKAGRVLIIRTADGKYARLEILSYYKGAPAIPTATDKSRFYTFRYFYQPDGSGKMK